MHPPGLLAHPLTQSDVLPVSPATVGLATAIVILGVAALVRAGGSSAPVTAPQAWRAADQLPASVVAARAAGLAALAAVVAIARFGSPAELENLAPALVVGLGWPLLLAACVLFGDFTDWVDPFDTIGRAIADDERPDNPPSVAWAAVTAVAWGWYYSVLPTLLLPRTLAAALLAYGLLLGVGTLVAGRRWLAGADIVAVLCSWAGRVRNNRWSAFDVPRHAALVLGITCGAVLFAELRTSAWWDRAAPGAAGQLRDTVGFVVFVAAVGAVTAWLARRARRRGAEHSVAVAGTVMVVGIVVAVALRSARLVTSVRLLPALLGDPLGFGWDLLGPVRPQPPPDAHVVVLAQLVVITLAGAMAAALTLRQSPSRAAAAPGVTTAVVLGVLAAVLVTVM